jgi:hypothetical protein
VFRPTWPQQQLQHYLAPPLVSCFSAPMVQSFVYFELSIESCNETIKFNTRNLQNVAWVPIT